MATKTVWKGKTRKGNTLLLKTGKGRSIKKVLGRKRNGKQFTQTVVSKVRPANQKVKSLGSLFGLKGKPSSVKNLGNGKVVATYKRKGKQVKVSKTARYNTSYGQKVKYTLITTKTYGSGYSKRKRY